MHILANFYVKMAWPPYACYKIQLLYYYIIVLLGGDIKSKKEKPESGDLYCNIMPLDLRRPILCVCEF